MFYKFSNWIIGLLAVLAVNYYVTNLSLSSQLNSSKSQLDSSFQDLMGVEKLEIQRLLDNFQTDLVQRLNYKVDKAENSLHGQGKDQMMELRVKLKEIKEDLGNIKVQSVQNVEQMKPAVDVVKISETIHTTPVQEKLSAASSEVNVEDFPFCDDLYLSEVFHNPDKHKVKIRNTLDIHPQVVNETMGNEVANGCYTPKHCISRQHIALVVPYRQREKYVSTFLYHIHKFLQTQHRSYCIILSEQYRKFLSIKMKKLNFLLFTNQL